MIVVAANMTKRPEVFQTLLAIGGLVVGLFVYIIDRRPDTVYFIPQWLSVSANVSPFFGFVGNFLPTFIHVFVFILLTAVILAPPGKLVIPICATWFTLDSLFEIAQIPVIAQWIARHVPAWFQAVPFLDNTAGYFTAGTFDVLDLFSIAAGTLCAYFILVMTYRIGPKNDERL